MTPVSPNVASREALPADPSELYGTLFRDVQEQHVFADQKTFVDCLPKLSAEEICARYQQQCDPSTLREFVAEHFLVPEIPILQAFASESLDHHLETLWLMLRREPHPVPTGSSLLPLTHPYIIPGGRFREIYYWDSYFTMLGLRAGGREPLLRAMTDNFSDLLQRFGMIPNGNRTYYLTRSQPPVLAAMVGLVAEKEGPRAYLRYLPALEAELAYWNDETHPTKHRVAGPGGTTLHRYYDQKDQPRPEAYAQDRENRLRSPQADADYYRNIRSAAESGWDFSSRWFVDGTELTATRTTELLPVDLNCFLLQLEQAIQRGCEQAGLPAQAERFAAAAARRLQAIQTAFWSETDGYFFDLRGATGARHEAWTLAGMAPLFVGAATPAQADAVAETLRRRFLQPGGLVTTLTSSGEQWDWPNGWAPLQWLAIVGLRQYGHNVLASEIARRWIRLNHEVFARSGRLLEKYNVVDTALPPCGGEYPTQDGFGWTNGVLARLREEFPA